MPKNLVIVESPAKAKTIEKYLGKDFRVLSSVGHIRSIVKKTADGTPPIDIDNGFKTVYEVDPEKKKIISELKKAVKAAETVWLATDEDREGEAIAWHLCEVLGLDPATTNRIVFHEITKDAIQTAIKNPRTIDMDLVQAQQARQILDRIVGFELSPVVWRKVPGGKSAGRVQSPAVRLIVEREQEIANFESASSFKVSALFYHDNQEFKAELKSKLASEDEARRFLDSLSNAIYRVSDVSKTPGTRNPGAPFTTSTLQQEASAKLGFGSKATMTAAQRLYQDGKITYMRTDSVNLSGQAIAAATDHIKRLYGPEYSTVRKFKTKNAGAQEAHEAIRPTDISRETASNNEYDQKLYDLIRRRTLASQMSPAKLENTTITIAVEKAAATSNNDRRQPPEEGVEAAELSSVNFEAKGQVVVFDGFLRVYGSAKDELLPALTSGDELQASEVSARQVFAKPPARYTEGSLVKKLEELGIGRPSTYATIIDTIQTRGYVEKGDSEGEPRDVVVLRLHPSQARTAQPASGYKDADSDVEAISRDIEVEKSGSTRGKLLPTPAGELIAGFLTDHFEPIVDYDFTSKVEEYFDDIAEGSLERNKALMDFYVPFHKLIESSGDIDRSKVGSNREVGTDPKTGKMIYARFGRFGPMLQLGHQDDVDKPDFAPLPRGTKIDTVTLEQAIEAFKLPRLLGETDDGLPISANIGRFGPFLQIGSKTKSSKPLYVSLKEDDPHDISLERALELYREKLKAEAEKNIADFGDVKVLNGRYGPYVTDGSKNVKVPKDTDPKSLDEATARKLLADAPTKKARKRRTTTRK